MGNIYKDFEGMMEGMAG